MDLRDIMNAIEQQLTEDLNRCGLMFRLFGRVKTVRSLAHKMEMKGDNYRKRGSKIQDVIGLRIVLYFPEDVELLGFFFSCRELVDAAVDAPSVDTFRPRRLNLVKPIPQHLVSEFRANLPDDYADYIDATYEIQIRTIFSEGWHEVEHDLRYKCKDDWRGYDQSSRTLNGVIATLETAEWTMSSLFRDMAYSNYERYELRAMVRNKLLIRLADDDFSPAVHAYLMANPNTLRLFYKCDRMVFLIMMLSHKGSIRLTYDNILFLINRFDIRDSALMALEDDVTKNLIDVFLAS